MKAENVDFPEAVRILAERAHIELPEAGAAGQTASRDEKTLIFRANNWAARMFHHWLLADKAGLDARRYLEKRGVTEKTIKDFQLGYAPGGWSALLDAAREKKIELNLLEKAGLILQRERNEGHYDRFRNRLIFPIRDRSRRVIAFGARALDDAEPKYINSPETPLFAKSRTLYGLDMARDAFKKNRSAIVVEGYMDVIMAHQHGIPRTVGVLGTALTRDHVRLLRRYVDSAVLVFDADSAGMNSAERSIDAFAAEELGVRVVALPGGLDPDDFLRKNGTDAFLRAVESAADGLAFKLDHLLDGLPERERGSPTQMAKKLDNVLATIALIPNTVTQSLEIKKIMERTGVPEIALQRRVERLSSGRRYSIRETPAAQSSPARREPGRELLEAMLTYPATIAYVRPRLAPDAIENAAVRELVERLFALAETEKSCSAADLLAHVQDETQRGIIEEIIGGEEAKVSDPEEWCRDLLAALKVREQRKASAEIGRKITAAKSLDRDARNRLLEAKLEAARESQRARQKLQLR